MCVSTVPEKEEGNPPVRGSPTLGAFIVRIRFWVPLYYFTYYNKEPPKHIVIIMGSYLGPYSTPKRIVHSGSNWQPQLVELIIAIIHVDVVLLSIRLAE